MVGFPFDPLKVKLLAGDLKTDSPVFTSQQTSRTPSPASKSSAGVCRGSRWLPAPGFGGPLRPASRQLGRKSVGFWWEVYLGTRTPAIGVLFTLVWLKIDGTGLDVVHSIYQGPVFFQKTTYDPTKWRVGTVVGTSKPAEK